MNYTVTLTQAEDKALSWAAASQQAWIDNAVHERCRVAIEGIAKICVEKCLETDTPVPGSKAAMVDLAFEQGWVKTVAQQNLETPGA